MGQFAFVACGVYAINDMARVDIVYLNDGLGWFIYVFVAAAMGAIINIYSFLVAGIWIMIISVVICTIAMLIVGCICLFCAVTLASDN